MTSSTERGIQGGPENALLMGQLKAGSVEAFSTLYDSYCDRAYQVAWCLCLDSHHAKRAVQEAFMALWRGRQTYQPTRGTVAAWVLGEVHAQATDLLSEDHHVPHTPADAPLATSSSRGDVTSGAEQSVPGEDPVRLLTLLAQLPEVQRTVIVLAFYGKLTHGEIAASLDLSPETVKKRMRLGLYTLKDAVDSGVISHTTVPKERALPDEGPAPQSESLERRRRWLRVVQRTLPSESGRIPKIRSNNPASINEQVRGTRGN